MFPHSVHIAGVDDAHERSAGFRAELLFGVADDIEGEGVRVEEGSVEIILDQRAQRGVIKGLEKRFLPPDGIVGVAPFRDIHNDAVDDGLAFLVFAFAARVPNPYEFPVFPLHTVFGGVGQGIGEAALAIRQGLRQVRRIDEFGHPAAAADGSRTGRRAGAPLRYTRASGTGPRSRRTANSIRHPSWP